MKIIRKIAAALLLLACLCLSVCAVGEAEAQKLHSLGLLAGKGTNADGSVNFDLTGSLTRAESITQVVRFLGKEAEATAKTNAHPFTDLPAWAVPYVSYAYANGVTKGVSDTKFDPSGEMTEAAFLTAILRVLGYEDKNDGTGDFIWSDPFTLAKSVGLIENSAAGESFVRGDAFMICYKALTAKVRSGDSIADTLVKNGVCDASAMAAALGESTDSDCPLTVGGIPLVDCRIVVSAAASATEKMVADDLAAAIGKAYGKTVPVVTDAEPQTDGELVIGQTNRPVSAAAAVPAGETTVSVTVSGKSVGFAAGSTMLLRQLGKTFAEQYFTGKAVTDMTESDSYRGDLICMPLRSASSGDPCITYDNETGYYYALYSAPKNDRVTIYRSKTLAGLGAAEGKTVYTAGENAEVKHKLYAPELAKIDGKWYVYASGATSMEDAGSAPSKSIRLFCLEAVSDDPYGDYVFKAWLNPDIYAIDAHAFSYKGENYITFARILSGNLVTIARLENPYTIDTGRISVISTPTYGFETRNGKVNEGPFTFEHDGRLFLLYSANNVSSDYYCLGMLEFTGTDILSKASWTKSETAVFAGTSAVKSPGHCSVFLSPDGSEYWLAYHYRSGSTRMLAVKPFGFAADGTPDFGVPVPAGSYVFAPAGE